MLQQSVNNNIWPKKNNPFTNIIKKLPNKMYTIYALATFISVKDECIFNIDDRAYIWIVDGIIWSKSTV